MTTARIVASATAPTAAIDCQSQPSKNASMSYPRAESRGVFPASLIVRLNCGQRPRPGGQGLILSINLARGRPRLVAKPLDFRAGRVPYRNLRATVRQEARGDMAEEAIQAAGAAGGAPAVSEEQLRKAEA